MGSDSRYYQLDNDYNVVRKHGGQIHLESAPDKGTSFAIYFPDEEGGDKDSPGKSVNFKDKGVLLIEDEPVSRRALPQKIR